MPARKKASDIGGGARIVRSSLTDQAYRHMKLLLMRGELAPGTRLVFRDVARELGTSVTPVREALLQLVAENALDPVDHGAIRVPPLSVSDCRELWRIRLLLEGECAEAAAANASPGLVEELTRSHQAMLAAKQSRRLSDALVHNMNFHFSLYRAAEMPLLLKLIESVWARSAAYVRFFNQFHVESRTASAQQGPHVHATIIRAVASKDAAGIRRGLERDLLEIRGGIERLLTAQSDGAEHSGHIDLSPSASRPEKRRPSVG